MRGRSDKQCGVEILGTTTADPLDGLSGVQNAGDVVSIV